MGKYMTRAIMAVLFTAILAYVGVMVFLAFSDPLQTTYAVSQTVYESFEVSGLLVRDETVLSSSYPVITVTRSEGEKVGFGQSLASVFLDENARNMSIELESMKQRLARMEEVLSISYETFDAAQLDQAVIDGLSQVNAAVSDGEYSRAGDSAERLQYLIYRREYAYGQGEDMEQSAEELRRQIAEFEAGTMGSSISITAPFAGIFSAAVDGFETLITPAALEDIGPRQISELTSREPDPSPNDFGKLISGTDWYFAAALPELDAALLSAGQAVQLRLSRDQIINLSLEVVRVGAPDNGQCAVIFKSDKQMRDVSALRGVTGQLIYNEHTGIRVPKRAIRVSEDGRAGVYVVEGLTAVFKAVEILYETEEYYLVADDKSSTRNLWPGEEVIVSAKDLFDGKVVRSE